VPNLIAGDIDDPQAASFDPEILRRVCGTYATGVAIVTTIGLSGQRFGLTVNSFTSVSLSPPLVLWALNRASPSRDAFDAAPAFAISILGAEQEEIARRFARPEADKFAGVGYFDGELGLPIIEGATGHLECRMHESFEAGDHVVYIGLVCHGSDRPETAPLAFHKGSFGTIARRDARGAA
jgi:flavin reductase (DIM6/NTAB) family NADH-FMN oxidoreductase RutF